MKDQESLQPGALVGQFTDPVQQNVDQLFTDGVMATGVIVGGIFFAGNELFRMEKLTVGASTNLI